MFMAEDATPPEPTSQPHGGPEAVGKLARAIEWSKKGIKRLFIRPRLPAWAVILFFIVEQVPDWKSRYDFWLEVAKQSGGTISFIANILLSRSFDTVALICAVVWLFAVGEPKKSLRHHSWQYVGIAAGVIVFAIIVWVAAEGYIATSIRDQVVESAQIGTGVGRRIDLWLLGFMAAYLALAFTINLHRYGRPFAGKEDVISHVFDASMFGGAVLTLLAVFNSSIRDLLESTDEFFIVAGLAGLLYSLKSLFVKSPGPKAPS